MHSVSALIVGSIVMTVLHGNHETFVCQKQQLLVSLFLLFLLLLDR